jgi:hypothetical protein
MRHDDTDTHLIPAGRHPDQLAFPFRAPMAPPALPASARFDALPEPKSRLVDQAQRTHRVIVYCAGSRGLENFLRPLELFAYKIGVTGAETGQARVEDLRRKHYAGLWGRADADPSALLCLEHSHEWAMWAWTSEHLQGLDLPRGFHLHRGCLEIEFPFGVSVQQVDAMVHHALKARSLSDYLGSPTGKARLAKQGLDPDSRLLTRYSLMEVTDRISAATEIYRIKPRVEFPRLVQILEKALAPLRSSGSAKLTNPGGNTHGR